MRLQVQSIMMIGGVLSSLPPEGRGMWLVDSGYMSQVLPIP